MLLQRAVPSPINLELERKRRLEQEIEAVSQQIDTLQIKFNRLRNDWISKVRPLPLHLIKHVVCTEYRVTLDELLSQNRRDYVTKARQIAMYLSRKLTSKSSPQIASSFANRDHTTILHAESKYVRLRKTDPAIDHELTRLTNIIESMEGNEHENGSLAP